MNVLYHDELIAKQNRWFWRSSIGLFVILGISTATNLLLVTRPTPAPVVVAVNPAGDPVGILQPLLGTGAIADATTRYALGQWIENAFTMESNFSLENDRLRHVYAMLPDKGQAYQQLTNFYTSDKKNNPGTASDKNWQTVKLMRTLKLPQANTYEVDFTLVRHEHADETQTATNWRAVMAVQTASPNADNLLGLYITSIDFGAEDQ